MRIHPQSVPWISLCVAVWLIPESPAGDWPQILGPNRDGIAVGETLRDDWPADGPVELWSHSVGQAFAGVAVRGKRVVLFHRRGGSEVVELRNVTDGNVIWSSPAACDYQSGMSSDSGPRCVPVFTEDCVYTFGADGMLRCLDTNDGREIWRRDTWSDFQAPEGYFGAGSTPLLVEDRLIVNVGGRSDSAVVAFSIKDGATLWQAFNDKASYSSPILATVNGKAHAIVVTRLNTLSLNPTDGSVNFQFPFGARGPTVNGASPVIIKDHLFVSSSYRVGSVWAKVTASGADVMSSGETLLATQYATPVRYGDVLFAVDGRQDQRTGSLCCIDPAAQKVLWRRPDMDYGTLIRAGDDFLFLTCEGELIRFKANTLAYREVSRSRVLKPTDGGHRLPALSNGRLFVRDNDTLKCLQVGAED